MARKQKHEEHENHERWLVSYADFITLLFAFFVVMYSLSSVNEGKFRVLAESLVAAFRSTPKSMEPIQFGQPSKSPNSPTSQTQHIPQVIPQISLPLPRPAGGPYPAPAATPWKGTPGREQVMQQIAQEVEQAVATLIDKDLITVRRKEHWLEVEIKTSILFHSGSARLDPKAIPVLREIAAILRRFPNPVRVEGFTDNRPISTIAYPSNWELSAGRAASVVHLFMDEQIPPMRMSAVGFGEHRPIADNSTEDGRNRNRRVVIVVLATREIERERDLRIETSEGDAASTLTRPEAAMPGRLPAETARQPVAPAAPTTKPAAPTTRKETR